MTDLNREYAANLLVAGAPKCGTSSLVDLLVAHPEIALEGGEKELFVLMDDDHHLAGKQCDLEGEPGRFAYRVDGTVHYLYQDKALEYFCNNSDVRALFVLRDPIERLSSAFGFLRFSHSAIAPGYSLSHFVEDLLEGESESLERNISGFHYPTARNELLYGKYSEYISSWLEVDEQRCRCIGFKSLADDQGKMLSDLHVWLGLSIVKNQGAMKSNESYKPRLEGLNALARRAARKFPSLRKIPFLREMYMAVNTSGKVDGNESIDDLETSLLSRLQEYYQLDYEFMRDKLKVID